MCNFQVRVHKCGHYDKNLTNPCEDAKRRKSVCKSGVTEVASLSLRRWCGTAGCDENPGLKREGPGAITDGDFDENTINWDDYND
ncbi:hypothetical protein BO86DRAFT_324304 [Aspergillus japonicus CBS 114.51]|uniref:Uncharacterized protein n=1 Tax=Aspergillus japonicus CBS 114.51 TaxID=1448312 RepID=A0A8T8WMB7_ASPJA|nr:hypothetical protein BO86DRAFT_324304 [Aspergillus japonicus CBS 114.51]RAH76995.1 hypothetical protein BO86DRAFT_324304 [Aspergillus japonicus CBS 114.51]